MVERYKLATRITARLYQRTFFAQDAWLKVRKLALYLCYLPNYYRSLNLPEYLSGSGKAHFSMARQGPTNNHFAATSVGSQLLSLPPEIQELIFLHVSLDRYCIDLTL